MFFEKEMMVQAVNCDDKKYTGTIYDITIQNCENDSNKPHALIFISQNNQFIEQEGEFGCVSLWVDKLKSLKKI